MNILLTGHKGFIGSNLLKYLSDHTISTYEWGDPLPLIKGNDWVIHIGAISSTTEDDVEKVLSQNLDFSIWLLNECNKNKVNFQYSSSASIYGKATTFKEDQKPNPQSPYAWSKYLFERYVNKHNWDITIQGFRYFNVYGPFESHKGNMASPFYKFKKEYEKTGYITLFENSNNYVRDFVHVDFVCYIHKQFFNVYESGIWNVGTGVPLSFEEVALSIAPKEKLRYVPMPDKMKLAYQEYTCANTLKLHNTLLNL